MPNGMYPTTRMAAGATARRPPMRSNPWKKPGAPIQPQLGPFGGFRPGVGGLGQKPPIRSRPGPIGRGNPFR